MCAPAALVSASWASSGGWSVGVLVREREGRRNRYRVDRRARLRHPVEAHCTVGDLLALVNG